MEKDLKLIVGQEQIVIMAYSQVMASASPVFRRMFQANGFAEGATLRKEGILELRLEEDHAEAFRIICKLFHHQVADLSTPDSITSNDLMGMIILTDKYDCWVAMKHWLRMWEGSFEARVGEFSTLSEISKWVYLSYELGYHKNFKKCTRLLITRASLDDFASNDALPYFACLPQIIKEKIMQSRRDFMDSLRSICTRSVDQMVRGHFCKKDEPTDGEDVECTIIMLGEVTIWLRQRFGDHWKRAGPWSDSIDKISNEALKFIALFRGRGRPDRPWTWTYDNANGHHQCRTSLSFCTIISSICAKSKPGLELDDFKKAPQLQQNK